MEYAYKKGGVKEGCMDSPYSRIYFFGVALLFVFVLSACGDPNQRKAFLDSADRSASDDVTYKNEFGNDVLIRSDLNPQTVDYDFVQIEADEKPDLYTQEEAELLIRPPTNDVPKTDDSTVPIVENPPVEITKQEVVDEPMPEVDAPSNVAEITTDKAPAVPDKTPEIVEPDPPSDGVIVRIVITESDQTMKVYENNQLIHTWQTSTGSVERYGPSAATPHGTWTPFLMDEKYWSRSLQVTLPWGIKFVGGILIHASRGQMGTPRSHGCVRLPPNHAETLFKLVKKHGMQNTRITVQA